MPGQSRHGAIEEKHDDWYSYWGERLTWSAFTLGQLRGPDMELEADTDDQCISEALDYLVPKFHEEVAAALLRGFGGNDDLFLALWRIRYPAPDPHVPYDEDAPYCEDNYDVLNCLTTDKMCGYQWITEGCPSERWWREHQNDD